MINKRANRDSVGHMEHILASSAQSVIGRESVIVDERLHRRMLASHTGHDKQGQPGELELLVATTHVV